MDKLEIHQYKQGIILPWKRSPYSTGLGGVLDSEGNFVESSYCHGGLFEHGGFYDWDKSQLQLSDEKVVYFGYFLPHWGHFLIDCLGRMWPYVDKDEYLKEYKLAFISQIKEDLYSNCYEFFQSLGISAERIIQITTPTQFKEVLIPDMDYSPKPNRVFAPQYLQVYDKVIKNILSTHSLKEVVSKFGDITKVYFTRSLFRGAKSREVGLRIIDKVFRNGGFNIIAPERLTLAEQILIWNNARQLACINGTIPLNVIFCLGGGNSLKLTVLNKMEHIHGNLLEYLKLRNEVDCEFIDIQDTRIRNLAIGDGRGLGPFRVGISEELLGWMERNGISTDHKLYHENLFVKK